MKKYAILAGYFAFCYAFCYVGIWAVLAFIFWKEMPDDNAFFRIIIIPSGLGAIAIHHFRKPM